MTTSQHRPPQLPQSDALLTLFRQEAHLQSTLQQLLDAQSEGLLAGLAGGVPARDDGESSMEGSRTPTTFASTPTGSTIHASKHSKSVVPVRQPPKRKLGLRGARRGIARTINDLAALKSEEGRILEDEVSSCSDILSTISSFSHKTTGLRTQIGEISSEESSRRVEDLKQEEKNLGNEIHAMETQLYEMKARQRHLVREIEGLSNSVQSKLSSYESALKLAEKDVRRFLDRPPLGMSTTAPGGGSGGKGKGMWSLPKERRTLEMAKDYYTEEQQTLKTHFEGVRAETLALEDGGVIWGEVVEEVNAVEKALREEMQRMQTPLLDPGQGERGATPGMKAILETMQKARASIENKLDHAESNNWKLLVCCIGAELEALTEGQAVLEGALEAAHGGTGEVVQQDGGESSHMNGVGAGKGALVDDGSAADSHDAPPPAQAFLDRSEDEDDGPGPELLISHHDE